MQQDFRRGNSPKSDIHKLNLWHSTFRSFKHCGDHEATWRRLIGEFAVHFEPLRISEMNPKKSHYLFSGGTDECDAWVVATLDDLVLFLDSYHFDDESKVLSVARDQYLAAREKRRKDRSH